MMAPVAVATGNWLGPREPIAVGRIATTGIIYVRRLRRFGLGLVAAHQHYQQQ